MGGGGKKTSRRGYRVKGVRAEILEGLWGKGRALHPRRVVGKGAEMSPGGVAAEPSPAGVMGRELGLSSWEVYGVEDRGCAPGGLQVRTT